VKIVNDVNFGSFGRFYVTPASQFLFAARRRRERSPLTLQSTQSGAVATHQLLFSSYTTGAHLPWSGDKMEPWAAR
jgi:hypothetical protein